MKDPTLIRFLKNNALLLAFITLSLALGIRFTYAQLSPLAITDLRVENNQLKWTAPSNVEQYYIRYYTGEVTQNIYSFDGCIRDILQIQHKNGSSYCAGNAVDINHQAGHTEIFQPTQTRTVSFSVSYKDSFGNQSSPSNIAIYTYNSSLPAITDLVVSNGDLSWTAPDNVDQYYIRFYTGEISTTTSVFGGCSADLPQLQTKNGSKYCAGDAVSITRQSGHTELLHIGSAPTLTFIVFYTNQDGVESPKSNAAVYSQDTRTITDLRVENNQLKWTAPSYVDQYHIQFYTGEVSTASYYFGGCSTDIPQLVEKNGLNYCAGNAVDITHQFGHTEVFQPTQKGTLTFLVSYTDSFGNVARESNTVVYEYGSTAPTKQALPAAEYMDNVLTTFTGYINPFPDTSLENLEGNAAAELYRRAVISGYADGAFKGTRDVNRAEAVKFLLLTRFGPIDAVEDIAYNGDFSDIYDRMWYTKYVITAANKGIINGYPDGLFRPGNTVNTAEFLKMVTLTFGLQTNLSYHYSDVKSTDWFSQYAGVATMYNLFPNRSSLLLPAQNLTRYEVAVAIYQFLKNR